MTTIPAQRRAHHRATGGVIGRRARFDAAVRRLAGGLLAASLALVGWWWVGGAGIQAFAGWATGLTSVGRLTGLVAADLLLAQVLLIARIPVLERAFGQDRLVRLHRIVGFTSFTLMATHVVIITWGYAGALNSAPAEFWNLTTTYPGMLLALAGTAALCMTVMTSVKAARRRLRYESWHLLHLYAYLGVGLALPHQLWTGQEFLVSPGATTFWWTAWAVSSAAVLWWRVTVPLARSARHRLRVTSVRLEGDDVVSVYLTGRDLDSLAAEAGQFVTLRFLNRAGWTRGNPYSLSAAPDGRSLRITVKDVGDNSGAVRALKRGTRALVEGPYGRLSSRARTRRKVALLGAGVGITPLRALAEGLDYDRGDAVLIQRFGEQPLFDRELRVLVEERGLELVRLPGSRRSPDSWLGAGFDRLDDAEALRSLVPDILERDVFLCGPPPWIESVRRAATAAGLAPTQLHVEKFGW